MITKGEKIILSFDLSDTGNFFQALGPPDRTVLLCVFVLNESLWCSLLTPLCHSLHCFDDAHTQRILYSHFYNVKLLMKRCVGNLLQDSIMKLLLKKSLWHEQSCTIPSMIHSFSLFNCLLTIGNQSSMMNGFIRTWLQLPAHILHLSPWYRIHDPYYWLPTKHRTFVVLGV